MKQWSQGGAMLVVDMLARFHVQIFLMRMSSVYPFHPLNARCAVRLPHWCSTPLCLLKLHPFPLQA